MCIGLECKENNMDNEYLIKEIIREMGKQIREQQEIVNRLKKMVNFEEN